MKKLALILFFFTSLNTFSAVYLKVMYIADYRVNCSNDTTKKCFVVRDNPTDEWSVLNYPIENFVYEDGTEYCVLVQIQTPGVSQPPIPFDSSQIKYVLSEIKSKTVNQQVIKEQTVNSIADHSRWILYKLKTKDEIKTFSVAKENMEFNLAENKVTEAPVAIHSPPHLPKTIKTLLFHQLKLLNMHAENIPTNLSFCICCKTSITTK